MYSLKPTAKYRKSIRKLAMSGRFRIGDLDKILNLLASGKTLEPKYRSHPLNGEYAGCFECHVKSDLLLIYEIDKSERELTIIDIGSHSDLFE
ncbi:MAG: type II toxin-antitoxin system YafQ family toxin [Candidatus Paceibacterota bacterium]|jgi:mRNA interferase YafQ